jgi:hypothetical protein
LRKAVNIADLRLIAKARAHKVRRNYDEHVEGSTSVSSRVVQIDFVRVWKSSPQIELLE